MNFYKICRYGHLCRPRPFCIHLIQYDIYIY
jgi:hypothetical protein